MSIPPAYNDPFNEDDKHSFWEMACHIGPSKYDPHSIVSSEHYNNTSSRFLEKQEFLSALTVEEQFMYCMFMYSAADDMIGAINDIY